MYKFKKISIRNMGFISNEVFAENCIHTIKQLKKEKEKRRKGFRRKTGHQKYF